MPKPATYPKLFDEALQLKASKLASLGYFEPNQNKSEILTWSRNGTKIARISVNAVMGNSQYIELDYSFNDVPKNYKIDIVSIPSNLGKGNVWYFICPHTYKRCRILYLIGGYFLHRKALKGCMYKSQTYSKRWRKTERIYGSYFDIDHYYTDGLANKIRTIS